VCPNVPCLRVYPKYGLKTGPEGVKRETMAKHEVLVVLEPVRKLVVMDDTPASLQHVLYEDFRFFHHPSAALHEVFQRAPLQLPRFRVASLKRFLLRYKTYSWFRMSDNSYYWTFLQLFIMILYNSTWLIVIKWIRFMIAR